MEKEVSSQYKEIDILINVSAILSEDKTNGPERSIGSLQRDWLTKSMDINLIGHM